jgi:hypothetical protein
MCELLVWREDKGGEEADYEAGDVIFVGEDGHQWGAKEIADPRWVILRAPGVPVKNVADYERPVIGPNSKNLRMRQTRLSPAFIAGRPGKASVTAKELDAAREDKRLADVGIIG